MNTSQKFNINDYTKEQLQFFAEIFKGPFVQQFSGYLTEMDIEAIYAGALGLESQFQEYYDC